MQTLLLFDIGSDRLRGRVIRAARDAGMDRLQFSVFIGDLRRERLARLRDRLEREIAGYAAREDEEKRAQALRVHLFPIDETSFGKAETLTRSGAEPCAPAAWPELMII